MRIVFVLQLLSTLLFGSIIGFLVIWQLMLIVWAMIITLALSTIIMISLTERHMTEQSRIMQQAATVFFFLL